MLRTNKAYRSGVALALSIASACNGDDAPPDAWTGLGVVAESCQAYLSCLMAINSNQYDAQLAQYGTGTACWTTPARSESCAMACGTALAGYSSQCTCVGPTCMSCVDSLEPNNGVGSATTAITDTPGSYTSSNVELCVGDADVFSVQMNATGRINASVTWTMAGAVNLRVLNAGGTAIATGTMSGASSSLQIQNLAPGAYFVEVESAAAADYVLMISTLAQ